MRDESVGCVEGGKGRCGKVRGEMWESVWGERGEVCWGVGEI